MYEKIMPQLYRIQIPLPKNPLKVLNSYVIKSKGRNLIIDTGFNRPECKDAMFSGLEELGIDLNKTDLFITHLHSDHSGLAAALVTDNYRVYASLPDSITINEGVYPVYWTKLGNFFKSYGFPLESMENALQKHPGNAYSPDFELNFTLVGEGARITAGDYDFRVVETPGHTPGHLCLYEPVKKILIAGDHILDDITPNISIWQGMADPLGSYLQSLEKVSRMDIELVLPAHRKLIADHQKRITELTDHHRVRLDEVLGILESGEADAYETASRMTWDMTYKCWEDFPIAQKWFAFGEAAAHLDHLAVKKLVRREFKNGRFVFSLLQ